MDIHLINQRLKDIYGSDLLGQPIFRVVWSVGEVEKRLGTFTDYLEGTNIFLREVTEVRECRKYPFLDPQYVLEKMFFNRHNDEILDNNTLNPQSCTYEPLWCFGIDKDGRAKPVIWRWVELLLMSHLNPEKLTPSQMSDKEKEQAFKDEQLMLEMLNEKIPNDSLHMAIQDGGAVMLNQDYSPDKIKLFKD